MDGRTQARRAAVLAIAAAAAPTGFQALTGARASAREIVMVELAGSGERILQVADGRPERLTVYRALLGLSDNVYVPIYCAPLLLGSDLLPTTARRLATALVMATAVADLVENAMLERSLARLSTDPLNPRRVDAEAALARRAALTKFAALIPAAGLASWGVRTAWRHP